mgnify:CR=1 FL=1
MALLLQGVDRTANAFPAAVQNVSVNHRCFHVLMPQQLLHGADVVTESGPIVKTNPPLPEQAQALGGCESLGFAQAVEKGKQANGQYGIDQRGEQQVEREERLRLGQQQASGHHKYSELKVEEHEGQNEPAEGVLDVDPRADRRRRKTDQRLGDAEQSDRRVAQAVLEQTDDHAQQQAGGRVPAAQPKVERDQQRQIEQSHPGQLPRQERLKEQRQRGGANDRPAVKLVNFDGAVGLGADFHFLLALNEGQTRVLRRS